MADFVKGLFGGTKSAAKPAPSADSDFADFVDAPAPEPEPMPVSPVTPGSANPFNPKALPTARPYTKWYNVHERHSLSEFQGEGFIIAVLAVLLVFHLVGSRVNRSRARNWIRANLRPLASEFAVVGFSGVPTPAADKTGDELAAAIASMTGPGADTNRYLEEKSLFEFATYATGRANVAFVDVKITLVRRFSPLQTLIETGMGFFFDSFPPPADVMEAVLYPFDGQETKIVPGGLPGAHELRSGSTKDSKSAYDGFVWAIVNKDCMKQVRDERYDVSITFTKDHAKLPAWLTVMSESAEITETLLTKDLAAAAEEAGDLLDYLIISDQPIEKPKTIEETVPRKRIFLKYRLPSTAEGHAKLVNIFTAFLRLSDKLVASAHFRPEVLRKVKSVRDETVAQIKREAEKEKEEERLAEKEKEKKRKRDAELSALDAKAQRKYLEKERERELKRNQKKSTMRA